MYPFHPNDLDPVYPYKIYASLVDNMNSKAEIPFKVLMGKYLLQTLKWNNIAAITSHYTTIKLMERPEPSISHDEMLVAPVLHNCLFLVLAQQLWVSALPTSYCKSTNWKAWVLLWYEFLYEAGLRSIQERGWLCPFTINPVLYSAYFLASILVL